MRLLSAIVLSILLAACATEPKAPVSTCPEPRPQVCTMEYNPTCAVLHDGGQREYSSPCNACADEAVDTVLSGPCPL